MMNVTEARQLTKEYFSKEISRHLESIEHYIKQVANAGSWRGRYTNDIIAARSEVRDAVINTLLEKGYKAEWADSGSAIVICWSES